MPRNAQPAKARLLYKSEVWRSRYWRRLPTLLIGLAAAVLAFIALNEANKRALVDPLILGVGLLTALLLGILLFILAGLCLFRALTRRSERVKVYTPGILWRRGGRVVRYSWDQVVTFREGARGIYLGRQPLMQWGAHRLTMRDGRVLKLTQAHGDVRRFARIVRPRVANITGARMARTLRDEKPVRLHPRLTLYPGGIEVRGKPIPWSQVRLRLSGGSLRIARQAPNDRVRTVARFNVSQIDNLGGMMELAEFTIRHHDPAYKQQAQERARATQELLRSERGSA